MKNTHHLSIRRRGFSLMEIALALVVVGIGMTAIVGIFPIALDTAADNNQQSRMALLAEEIAHGLRAKVIEEGANLDWSDNSSPNFGGILKLDLAIAKLPKTEIWTAATDAEQIEIDGQYHGFVYLANAASLAAGIDNHNIGYRVLIQLPDDSGSAHKAFSWKSVREVRIDMFASHSPRNQAGANPDLVYYTEIHKPVEVH
jgi:prepilin-type N-terminal cleavage/methylation domain-containing protein